MNKYELAQYLVNLHTLLQAQTSSVHNASATLVAEYERCWDQLKENINDETRQSSDKHDDGDKDRTNLKGDKSGSRITTGNNPRAGDD